MGSLGTKENRCWSYCPQKTRPQTPFQPRRGMHGLLLVLASARESKIHIGDTVNAFWGVRSDDLDSVLSGGLDSLVYHLPDA